MNARGEVKSEEDADTTRFARSSGTALVPLIVNEEFSAEAAHEILSSEGSSMVGCPPRVPCLTRPADSVRRTFSCC